MTIAKAISEIDAFKPNGYTIEEKIEWISILDWMVKKNVIDTHEGGEEVEYNGYTITTPMDTELLIPAPYEECYIAFMESKIDYYNHEYGLYNNSITHFNEMFVAFQNAYNREHMPLGEKVKYF